MILKLKCTSESSIKTGVTKSSPRVSALVDWKWCPRTCLFNEFPGHAAAVAGFGNCCYSVIIMLSLTVTDYGREGFAFSKRHILMCINT